MLGERLAESRKRNGWSQGRLAAAIGKRYDGSMISHVEAGRSTLHFDGLVKAARALDVSIDYLAGLTKDPTPADDRSPSSSSRLQRVPIRDFADREAPRTGPESGLVLGHLVFRRDWMEAHGINPGDCSVIDVPDDSMEPTLQAGGWVLVDHLQALREGSGIFAVDVGKGLYVRRAVYSDQDWLLVGDNPKCRNITWPPDAKIIGQVVWTGRVL